MPAEYHCYPEYFVLVYSGTVLLEESIDMYNRLSEDYQFDSARYAIIDCRDLQAIDYSDADYKIHTSISMAVSRWQRSKDDFRVGAVVTTPEAEMAVKKVMHHAEHFKQAWTRKIFHDYDEAVAWASENLLQA